MTVSIRLLLPDEVATQRAGAALGAAINGARDEIERHGLVIGLSGDLGAGKTTWIRATLRALGVAGNVKSPTFSILEAYVVSRLNFYHFDFYRFKEAREFSTAGFREYFGAGAVCAIEWPQHAAGYLPAPDLLIELSAVDAGRVASVNASTILGEPCLTRLTAQLTDLIVASNPRTPAAGN